ncbi:GAF domain-containing protein [Antrihabitans cavernicola]|uniref:Rv3651-like N-terminal domain-containing protein n=1 Tax=Antrihabitans cavernicola TaxID=2495913 RepID=A0A5A7SCD0_9NOCA|nr:GAF domain-containing protein [Spelaeibacter cavernicola]KAA0023798.1 hypothetical protein FOY51_04130 [Spelaeibacter cavernicola]
MTSSDWIVVETLVPAGPHTVIADGAEPRSWASLTRIRAEHGPDAAGSLVGVVTKCVETAGSQQESILRRRGGGRLTVLAVPILGAFGHPHGAHVWVGADGDQPPPRRRVAAVEWDAKSQSAHHGADHDELILGTTRGRRGVTRPPNDFFRRIVRFDDRIDYLTLAANIEQGGRFEGNLTLHDDCGGLRVLRMAARAYSEGDARSLRILVHDISDVQPPEPAMDTAALRAVAGACGDGAGLMTLDGALIFEWLSPPPGRLAAWEDEPPFIRQDDQRKLEAMCARLRLRVSAPDETLVVHVRFGTGEWIRAEIAVTRIVNDPAPLGLAIVRLDEED